MHAHDSVVAKYPSTMVPAYDVMLSMAALYLVLLGLYFFNCYKAPEITLAKGRMLEAGLADEVPWRLEDAIADCKTGKLGNNNIRV